MPSPFVAADELQQFAVPSQEEMRRDMDVAQALEVRVAAAIETVREEALDRVASEVLGGQADVMNHQRVDHARRRALVAVGAGDAARHVQPACTVELHRLS
jgi:hypothetical protein